jgi:hypothetical protein
MLKLFCGVFWPALVDELKQRRRIQIPAAAVEVKVHQSVELLLRGWNLYVRVHVLLSGGEYLPGATARLALDCRSFPR